MNPPSGPLFVTREQAATRQVEAAISALERGEFDIAITLAGAAEGMFDFRKEGTILEGIANAERALTHFEKKDWINILNMERNWLKHSSDRTGTIAIELFSAAFMIARAASKLTHWTQPLHDFKAWYLGWLSTYNPSLPDDQVEPQ
ncbi:MAG TPA: hypothetical protein VNQ99_16220 [Xanthobacteraceae bacterium]|nr:hypothetical protein [Xanthobacteraceae bacterium]